VRNYTHAMADLVADSTPITYAGTGWVIGSNGEERKPRKRNAFLIACAVR
jgi:hypothetical protein